MQISESAQKNYERLPGSSVFPVSSLQEYKVRGLIYHPQLGCFSGETQEPVLRSILEQNHLNPDGSLAQYVKYNVV